MSTEFQNVMDFILANINCVIVSLVDILVVIKRTKFEHLNKVREVMNFLDEANLQLKAETSMIANEL